MLANDFRTRRGLGATLGKATEGMDQALLSRVEKQAWFHRYPRAMPFTLFAISLLATVLFVNNFTQLDREAARGRLVRQASGLTNELEYKAAENTVYLNAAASLFSASQDVTQRELQDLLADLGERAEERGVLGIGWARWMKAAEVSAVQEAQRQTTGNGTFTIRPLPASPFDDMAVITVLSPERPPNRRAMGYDMYSEPVRRAAIDSAISTGQAGTSGKVHLVQDQGRDSVSGFLIYVPVFERLSTGRRWVKGPLKGFVYSPIRTQEFLNGALRRTPHENINIRIFDGPPSGTNLIAQNIVEGTQGEELRRSVRIGDRNWTLVVNSVETRLLSTVARLTLLSGILFSLLILALSWLATSRAAEDRKVLEWLSQQNAIRLSLTRELNHRVKNTLANVLSIVSLTRRRSHSIDEFADGLNGRIRALSATHDLLAQRDWSGAPLSEVVKSELAPYLDPDDSHADLEGPDVALAPNDALSLGLALHELATNAAKYGALSTPAGRVAIKWRLLSERVAEVDWKEAGGPPVVAPTSRGFGLDLIEKIVSHELKAAVELEFAPDGVHCRLKVPVRGTGNFAMRKAR